MSEIKKIATRESYGNALVEVGKEHEDLIVLDADLAGATKTGIFKKAFPERHWDVGIAEANMTGIAAGLATCGKVPFISSFAMFAAGRNFEQVRNSIGYPHLNVKIGATHAGISVGEDGATHQCLEDIALMRTIPGMVVINPADDVEARATGAAHEQSDDQYFKTADELYDTLRPLFSGQWDFDSLFRRMCRPTVEIAGRADASFETGRMFMPEYRMRPEERERYGDRRTMFLRLLDDGLDRKVPEPERERYRERLDEEVYIIESTDNVDYFLVQWDMVREAHRRGIATGIGRGSAGGSLVSYLLGITSIDPLKYDLIFSRFLVPERCGLSWKDELTVLAPDITLGKGERYVEMESEGKTYRLCTDARMRVIRNGEERTIYADELMCGDEILFDRRDCLWNLKELETHESDLRTPPSL